jgi:hypothetical protein
MNEQERELLNALLNNLVTASVGQKDPEADDLIRRAIAQQPNATYLLVQRTLLQDVALKNAQARIAALEQQLRLAQSSSVRASGTGSFLGGGWEQPTVASNWAQSSPPPYPQQNVQPAVTSRPQPSAFSSFLRSAATTAAGVAGGELLFQGFENLFGHRGGFQDQPQEIVENFIEEPPIANQNTDFPQDNYYPDDSSQFIPNNFDQAGWDNAPGFDDNNFDQI